MHSWRENWDAFFVLVITFYLSPWCLTVFHSVLASFPLSFQCLCHCRSVVVLQILLCNILACLLWLYRYVCLSLAEMTTEGWKVGNSLWQWRNGIGTVDCMYRFLPNFAECKSLITPFEVSNEKQRSLNQCSR